MPRNISHTTTGFTLVELSMVLIIIGLLAAGLFVGRGMIDNAKIRATLADVEQFSAATNTFNNKYGGLPGDVRNAPGLDFATRIGGDNDGFIGPYVEGQVYFAAFCGEFQLYWADLYYSGLINKLVPDGNNTTAPSCLPGTLTPSTGLDRYLPASPWGQSLLWSLHRYDSLNPNRYSFLLFGFAGFASSGSGWMGTNHQDLLPVWAASAIDIKTDDGNPTTGKTQAIQPYGTGGYLQSPAATCGSSTGYNLKTGTFCSIYMPASF